MGLDLFLIIVVLYIVMGIGTAKIMASLNHEDSSYGGGFHLIVAFCWPICIVICAFWNFKND